MRARDVSSGRQIRITTGRYFFGMRHEREGMEKVSERISSSSSSMRSSETRERDTGRISIGSKRREMTEE